MFKRIVISPVVRPNGTVRGALTGYYAATLPDADILQQVCLEPHYVAGRRVMRTVAWVERAVMHGDYVITPSS